MSTCKTMRIKYTAKLELVLLTITMLPQPTLTQCQCKPCHALDSMYDSVNPTMAAMPAAPVRSRIHFCSVVWL